MKRLLFLSLLFISLTCFAKSKTVILGYIAEPDSTIVHMKDGTFKKVSNEDFYSNYVCKPIKVGPNATVVSGSSSYPCLGGRIYLVNSRFDADLVIRETSRNDYDCSMRIVNHSPVGCNEWEITRERALADHVVYISDDAPSYDYKVKVIR